MKGPGFFLTLPLIQQVEIMAKNKKTSPLKLVRVCFASVVFVAFTLLFLNMGGVFDKALGWLPKFQFWPAVLALNIGVLVLLLALTILFGRVYCSFLCPLGIMQDGIYAIRTAGAKKKKFQQSYSPALNILRYVILALFLGAAAFGIGATAYLVEPYSIFGRMVASFTGKSMVIGIISAVTFAVIAVLVWKSGRSWCNTICPVGSILGLLSRWSIFKPVIDQSKCVDCGLCAKGCRASCIDAANHKIDTSRCVVCFDCIGNCNSGAISFRSSIGKPAEAPGRRAFITASAFAIGAASLKAQEGHGALGALVERKNPDRKTPIVPAGSKSLKNFDDHCVGCQLCVEACPNNVLRPSLDPQRFMQPQMNFEKGFCRPECNACSRVCPAGAIVELLPEEKTAVSIGHAVYNTELCVVRTDDVDCGNCARHCPAGAISMVKSEELGGRRIPVVNPERCIGCGHCEYVCPSRPVSAIHVEGNEVHRSI